MQTRETTRCLKRTDTIPKQEASLKSTGSAKRSLKIERITLSGTAMRNKRCMFKNINVSRAKEAFVVKYWILKFPVQNKLRQKVRFSSLNFGDS